MNIMEITACKSLEPYEMWPILAGGLYIQVVFIYRLYLEQVQQYLKMISIRLLHLNYYMN